MPKTLIATISGNAVEPISYNQQLSGSLRVPPRRRSYLHKIHEDGSLELNPSDLQDTDSYSPNSGIDRDSGISLDLYRHMPTHLVSTSSTKPLDDISLQEITTPGVQQETSSGAGVLVPKDQSLQPPPPAAGATIDPHHVNSFLSDAKKHGFHVILSPELLSFITSQPRSHQFYHSGPEDMKNLSSERSESLFDSAHGSDQTLPTSCDDSPTLTKRVIFSHPLDPGNVAGFFSETYISHFYQIMVYQSDKRVSYVGE